MKNKIIHKHKAISTIIGTIIFLVLMVATFGALIAAFQLSAEIFETQIDISDFENQKSGEKFRILPSTKTSEGNKLFVQVFNEGSRTIEVRDLWISNASSADNFDTHLIEINFKDSFVPIGDKKQILRNQPITLENGRYEIKVVTKLGNIQFQNITVPLDPLHARMLVDPPHLSTGNNATLIFEVQNKGNTTINGVRAGEPIVFPGGSVDAVTRINFRNVTDLEPLETITWKWNYRLFGGVGTITNFTTAAWGYDSVTGENVTSNVVREEVKFIPSARAVLQKADINMLLPSPFGETNQKSEGLMAVTVSNPTDIDITVTRVIITLASPGGGNIVGKDCDDGDEFFALFPSVASEWSCPANNVIQWADQANPEPVTNRNATTFMIKIQTGTASGGLPDPAIIATGTIFSSFGQTSASGFVTGMSNDGVSGALINVYLADPTDNTDCCLDDEDILSGAFSIESGTLAKEFRVALSDFSGETNSGSAAIGTKMIVIVPSGFKNVLLGTGTDIVGFDEITAEVIEFTDGSTQIIVITDEVLGDGAPEDDSFYITFTADVPSVTSNALFLMIALGDGITDTGFAIGPIAEIPIQVVP